MTSRRNWPGMATMVAGVILAAFFAGTALGTKPSAVAQTPTNGVSVLRQLEHGFTSVAERAEPAVVSITVERPSRNASSDMPDIFRDFFGPRTPSPRGDTRTVGGSGVIVREDGYILTNDHVIEGASNVTVKLHDGRRFEGTVLRDRNTDLALVKIDATKLPTARLADSNSVRVGSWAIAIGSPFGLSNTLTVGVISALEREAQIQGRFYASLIQTDASINPGNSGGPLLNIDGEVIGINVAIESPTGANAGIGYAIPSNTAAFVMEQLIERGKVIRGYMGLVPVDITPEDAQIFGVSDGGALVSRIDQDTPASKAGLQVEDVIIEYDGQKVTGSIMFRDLVARTEPGKQVKVRVIRNKETKEFAVTVGERPDEEVAEGPATPERAGRIGLQVSAITPELRQQFSIGNNVNGVVVTRVSAGGPAARAGILEGDVILRVNTQAVTNPNQFGRILGDMRAGATAFIVVQRAEATMRLQVRIPSGE